VPESDRLEELRRQRNALRDELDRVEDEIAALLKPAAPSPSPSLRRGPLPSHSDEDVAAEANALIEKYAQPAPAGSAGWKAGCWVTFAALLAIGGLALGAIYYGYYR